MLCSLKGARGNRSCRGAAIKEPTRAEYINKQTITYRDRAAIETDCYWLLTGVVLPHIRVQGCSRHATACRVCSNSNPSLGCGCDCSFEPIFPSALLSRLLLGSPSNTTVASWLRNSHLTRLRATSTMLAPALLRSLLALCCCILSLSVCARAYIPAVPTNTTTTLTQQNGLNVSNASNLNIQWYPGGENSSPVSYQLVGAESNGISEVCVQMVLWAWTWLLN